MNGSDGPGPMTGRSGNPKLRLLYLAMGVLHDRRFLMKFAEQGYDATYAYILSTGKSFEVPGVESRHLGYTIRLGEGRVESLKRIIYKAPAFVRFIRLLRRSRPDVLHATWLPVAGFWAALSGFHPLVISIYGVDVRERAFREPLTRAIVRFILKRADAVVCDCDYSRTRAMELVPSCAGRFLVFPWGIELDRYRPMPSLREQTRRRFGWTDGDRMIVVTRRFEEIYGVDDMIRAFGAVAPAHPGARLALFGEGPLEGRLRGLADQLGWGDRVRFMGAVPHHEMPAIYNAADIYLNGSREDGSSLSMMEALACGLPVLTADIPTTREWIRPGENGELFPVGDWGAAAAHLSKVLSRAEWADRLRRGALATAIRRADWDKNFSELKRGYSDLTRRTLHGWRWGRLPSDENARTAIFGERSAAWS